MHDIRFTTVSGTDESGDIPWLSDNPVRWWITDRDGNQVVIVATPCGGFQAVVKVTDEQITLDQSKMAVSAIFCEPPHGDYDRWVHELTELPLNYVWDEEALTISNDRGSLTMTPDVNQT